MKILVVTDSFKGSLSSIEVATIVERELLTLQGMSIKKIPIADGGEGTVDALIEQLHAEKINIQVTGPMFDTVNAYYAYQKEQQLAIIELAQCSGLSLVAEVQRNPLSTTSYGLGEMLLDAAKRGAKRIIIGLGGSATNDGGSGMAEAIGVKFFDRAQRPIRQLNGGQLENVSSIDVSGISNALKDIEITIASDVNNPLIGKLGCAHVFAKQKGADDRQIDYLDNAMTSFANVVNNSLSSDATNTPGSGAAGGLGYGLLSFLSSSIQSGIELILELVEFDSLLEQADLVITGEGRIDAQTKHGKAPFGVLERAKKKGVDTICIAGSSQQNELLEQMGFKKIYTIVPDLATLKQSLNQPEYYLKQLTRQIINDIEK